MGEPGPKDSSRPELEPIAICGMSMRLPGGVRSAQDFWEAITEKKELLCTVPDDRFNVDTFHSPHGKAGTIISPKAFYLTDAELGHFDTSMFPISPHELRYIDPQQRMLLEVTQECLENAGETNWRGKLVGCYVGTFGEDWLDLGAKDPLDVSIYRSTGASDLALSNRISYEYDFRGPSMTIKTGCSAAMMGLNEAFLAINARQCDSAVVAGANLIMTPTLTASMSSAVLSPTGTCKTFDAAADGYSRGEAINAIYVKRLSDAIADGNVVRAVIRGVCANSDGQTSRTLTPSLVCQESLIRQTYAQAGLPFHQTAYFECHGTGTRVGDPIEASAVARVFNGIPMQIGAVKPNFGHSEGASALTSIIKAVLALENNTIPPTMRFTTPSPAIEWKDLTVPTAKTPWPQDREERVSVNSFGIGGANGHVIIDSARKWVPDRFDGSNGSDEHHSRLLVLSATHEQSLARLKSQYEMMLSTKSSGLYDLAHTLAAGRNHHQYRAYCTTSSNEEGKAKFSNTARVPKSSRVVFVFSGQGNVWPHMAQTLLEENITFRNTFARLHRVLTDLSDDEFSLRDTLSGTYASRPQDAEISQPLSTAIQICLCNSLEALGVRPDAVVGHSSGEICAAYVSGALAEEEAIKIAYYRGQAIKLDTGRGAMSTIGLGRNVVEKLQLHGATLACDNSPSSVTISGKIEQIEKAEASVEETYPNALVKRLQVDKAYHSSHMKSAGKAYEQMLSGVLARRPAKPKIPFFSTLTGVQLDGADEFGPEYWRQHLECPVLFRDATEAIVSAMESDIIFAEIGPHPALSSSLIQTCAQNNTRGVSLVSFMRRSQNTAASFLDGVGRLYQLGVDIDFHALTPRGKMSTDLPTYPWHHETIQWNESRIGREWRFSKYARHDLLGVRTGESSGTEPAWRNILRIDDVSWIRHHLVESDVVFPFTGFCSMAGEAVQQIHDQRSPFSLRRVRVSTALTIGQSDAIEIITALRPAKLNDINDSSWYDFSITSFDGSRWIKHCTGAVRIGRDPTFGEELQPPGQSLPRAVDVEEWYSALAEVGLQYGTEFQRLQSISADVHRECAAAAVNDERAARDSFYEIHPATLDSTIQLIGVAASRGLTKDVQHLFVPVGLEDMYVASSEDVLSVRAEAVLNSKGTISGGVTAYSGNRTVLQIRNLTLYPMGGMGSERPADPHAAAQIIWTPDPDMCTMSAALKCTGTLELTDHECGTLQRIVNLLATASPVFSVLELASDSGRSTERILASLRNPSGENMFAKYTIGCSSEERQMQLNEEWNDTDTVSAVVHEISNDDPSKQAHPHTYDLVVIDNTRLGECPENGLANLKRLVSPGGRIILHNLKPVDRIDTEDGRDNSGRRCNVDAMSRAGLSDVELVGDTVLVARADTVTSEPPCSDIAILGAAEHDGLVSRLMTLCSQRGISAKTHSLEDLERAPISQRFLLSTLDIQGQAPLLGPSKQKLERLLRIFQTQERGMLWLTKPDPNCAMIHGLARTIHNELSIPFFTLEMPEVRTAGEEDAIMKVLEKCIQETQRVREDGGVQSERFDPDFEYAYTQGCIQVPRFRWKSLLNDLRSTTPGECCDTKTEGVNGNVKHVASQPARMRIGKVGQLDTLHWEKDPLLPMERNDVEVRVEAAGVNFKDVLVSLGIVDVAENALGTDGAGVVTQIGEDVDHVQVGDRVMFCGPGTFKTHARGAGHCCIRIPDTLTFNEAATMPCVFLTVMYSLLDLGRLEKGESVLIHSACGGVGLAAIQLAQIIGAEIFVTVGNDEKIEHLVQNYNIPRDHIFFSRSAAFYLDIMRQTGGRGVDVVLNSLSGELLHASWRCVAKFGRMIEIGKRDMLSFGKLDLDHFEANRTYVGLSLDEVIRDRPHIAKRLFAHLSKLLYQGAVKPILPMKVFAAKELKECLQYMQQGQAIGKLVVEIPQQVDNLEVSKELLFDTTASYLLVGGLGGLGRAIARWMISHGAVHLIFLSRSAGLLEEHGVFFDELRAMGAVCTAIAGNIADKAVVERTVTDSLHPIKGVVQASMVLKDVLVPNMTFDDWNAVLEPKVKGTWNLHNALLGTSLDFFIVLGSLSGIIGQHGQSNYNSANSFLNAFVAYRHSLKLAGSMLNLSAVDGIGILRTQKKLLRSLKEGGAHLLREQEVLEGVHWAIENSKPWEHHPISLSRETSCLSLGLRSSIPLQKLDDSHPWKRDRRMALYHNSRYATEALFATQNQASQNVSQRLLDTMQRIFADPGKELSDNSTAIILAEEIAKKAFEMLLRTDEKVDITMTMADVGLDSLMATQLRQWWRSVFRVELNLVQVANAKTFEGLGVLAVSLLSRKLIQDEFKE